MNKIVKLTLILFLVSALVAGVLGLTNMVTEEPIRLYKEQKTAEAYGAVMDFDSYEEVEYTGLDRRSKRLRLSGNDNRRGRRQRRPQLQRHLHHFQLRDQRSRLQGKQCRV